MIAIGAHKLGEYWIGPHIASGGRGSVYYASNLGLNAVPTAALKWPSTNREMRTLKALQEGGVPCLGVPLVYEWGEHNGKPWLIMELLSKISFKNLMRRLFRLKPEKRWGHVKVLGRLLLRRLRAVHERGFVHCDIHPSNIIFGRKKYSNDAERYMPFFVDFGLAHPHPGGDKISAHAGTITYTSIRSGDGCARLPRDDVEALGWMLCHATAGNLPWVPMIDKVDWKDKERRAVLVKDVQEEKAKVLAEGCVHSLEVRFNVPPELAEYLRLCQRFGLPDEEGDAAKPDYEALAVLLGETLTEEDTAPSSGAGTLFDFDDLPDVPGAEDLLSERDQAAEQRDLELLQLAIAEI